MKKTYKNPTLKVVKTRGARLLALSLDPTSATAGNAGAAAARRSRFSDWDEDE